MAANTSHSKTNVNPCFSPKFIAGLFAFISVLWVSCGGMARRNEAVGFGGGWGQSNVRVLGDSFRRDSSHYIQNHLKNLSKAKRLCTDKVLLLRNKAAELIASDSILYKAGITSKSEHMR